MFSLNKILEYEIIPNKGINDILLGQSSIDIIDKIVTYDSYFNSGSLKVSAMYPVLFILYLIVLIYG